MNATQGLLIVVTLFIQVAPSRGIQAYSYSGPVDGWADVALNEVSGSSGGYRTTFGTLAETLYYDPVALTFREVGSLTISPSSGSFDITRFTPFYGIVGSVALNVGDNGIFSFDFTSSRISDGAFWGTLLVPVSGVGIYK